MSFVLEEFEQEAGGQRGGVLPLRELPQVGQGECIQFGRRFPRKLRGQKRVDHRAGSLEVLQVRA